MSFWNNFTLIFHEQGVELGPLEIQINSLQKSIEAEQQEIAELQQMWLRDQSELVRLSKEKEKQTQDVENLKKQLTILSQKKLRIEGETLFYSLFNLPNNLIYGVFVCNLLDCLRGFKGKSKCAFRLRICTSFCTQLIKQILCYNCSNYLSFCFNCTGEINRQNLETADIERNIRHMQNDMIKLNKLIHKEKGTQEGLTQNNILMESNFIGSLKVINPSCFIVNHKYWPS